ncbi:AMP-binding protein [Rudaeicoccus suwonensis]|uniref:2-aminobenzoate-CoA ligase n=1 Tax=Rudaeicoccus suwonensis TaxID=657409 RepID=A0A561E393_9MICO|nr:AMP-binding protein [Rudaeicoccus suwonensis]TWE10061.1 2-aminobenzoate-CoA ligase [Rudaeicoccus suwonensis]
MQLSASAHVDTFTRDNLPDPQLWPRLQFTLPQLQYPDRLNAAAVLLDDTVERLGRDRSALLMPDGTRWTYGDLQDRSRQIANVLVDRFGVVPGSRVVLRSPNNPWLVACWLGVLRAGGVVVTTMPMLRATELAPVLDRTRPALVVADHRFAAEVSGLVDERCALVTVGGDGEDDLVQLCAAAQAHFTDIETAADDVALLGPTSGTTGVPKVTMHFHRDIISIAETFGRELVHLHPDDLVSCTAPLAFTFGLGALVVFPLRAGAAALLTETATPSELAHYVSQFEVTALFTAPTAYRAILAADEAHLLASVRVAVSAGEHISEQTWRAMREQTGLQIIDGIGATEMLHVFISAAGDDIRPGATGRPVPGFEAAVLDADGNPVPDGEPGLLGVVGPTGCRYLDDDRQRSYVLAGWNITGDTFVRDADGYFHFQARSDDMIVSSGYNIGAPEVESAIVGHPDVLEAAVVAKPDLARGTIVCAFVVLREGVAADAAKAAELQDYVKSVIAPYKYPREIRFVEGLPRNPSGKVQHFLLRKRIRAEIEAAAAADRTQP